MSTYTFLQLDPRPQAENPDYQFGIEVTIAVPEGITNLDHHGPEATAETLAACEQALTCKLPPEGATIATVRPDADSVTAMAVLASRAEGRYVNPDLVYAIGLMDRYGPRVESSLKFRGFVVAIARRATDFKVPLAERVTFIQACLDGTADVDEAAKLVTEREAEYEAALVASKVHVIIPDKLVFVESTHRFATSIGYQHATTVVAFNPEMAIRGEEGTYKKFTVCRWDSNVSTDLEAVCEELNLAEALAQATTVTELRRHSATWGGRGDIIGSPQNQNSRLSPVEVIAIVAKHTGYTNTSQLGRRNGQVL